MPATYRRPSYPDGSLYPELDKPYPLAFCVVVWVIVFSLVLAAIFSTVAFVISISAAIVSAFTAGRN